MDSAKDISLQLISEDEIKRSLASIFVDSIVLKTDFTIRVISENVLDILEFSSDEVVGKNLNYLTQHELLTTQLEEALRKGYFEDVRTQFITKGNLAINICISGFYLGLISDLNGYIILKIKRDTSGYSDFELGPKTELDRFIYRTSHDLRGPLATIKGLVNLLKLRADNSEVDEMIRMIDVNAEKLDDKLLRLFYLAGADEAPHPPKGTLRFSLLESGLRETLEINSQLDSLELVFRAPEPDELPGLNEFLVTTMVNNLVLYLISLPLQTSCRITMEFKRIQSFLNLQIEAEGFATTEVLRRSIRHKTFIYNDMLTYPYLVNYYTAQKIAIRLETLIRISFVEENKQSINLSIPIWKESQLSLI